MQSCYQRPLTIADKAAIMTQLAVPAAALFIGFKIHIVDPKSLSKGALSGRIAMIFASSMTQVTLMVKGLNNHGECPHKYWYYSLSLSFMLLPTCMGKLSPFFTLSIYATQCFISVTTLRGTKLPPENECFALATKLDQCNTQDTFIDLHKKFIRVAPSLMDQKNLIHPLFEKLLNQWISLVKIYPLIQPQLVEELYNKRLSQI